MSHPLIPIISNYIFLIHVYLLIKEYFIKNILLSTDIKTQTGSSSVVYSHRVCTVILVTGISGSIIIKDTGLRHYVLQHISYKVFLAPFLTFYIICSIGLILKIQNRKIMAHLHCSSLYLTRSCLCKIFNYQCANQSDTV